MISLEPMSHGQANPSSSKPQGVKMTEEKFIQTMCEHYPDMSQERAADMATRLMRIKARGEGITKGQILGVINITQGK